VETRLPKDRSKKAYWNKVKCRTSSPKADVSCSEQGFPWHHRTQVHDMIWDNPMARLPLPSLHFWACTLCLCAIKRWCNDRLKIHTCSCCVRFRVSMLKLCFDTLFCKSWRFNIETRNLTQQEYWTNPYASLRNSRFCLRTLMIWPPQA